MIKLTRNPLGQEEAYDLFRRTRQPANYSINANGTFQFDLGDGGGNADEEAEDDSAPKRSLKKVCGPVKFVRKVEYPNGDLSVDCVLLDSQGRTVLVRAPVKELVNGKIAETLSAKGLKVHVAKNLTGLLRAIYNDLEPDLPTVRIVSRQGLQSSGSIVLDDLVIGHETNLTIDPAVRLELSTSGRLEDWIDGVSRPALMSSACTFAIAHAFGAFLKCAAGLENAAFNLFGPSSRGKTSALHAAASTMGFPKRLARTWHATEAGFEEQALMASGLPFIRDEARIGLGDKDEEHVIFALANGHTKEKARGYGGGVALHLWALSSQEDRADDPYKGRPRSGADVRLFRTPAGYDRERGIFEKAADQDEAKAMAVAIKSNAAKFHGTPFVAFATALLELDDWSSEILDRVEAARHQLGSAHSNLTPVQSRGLDSFAIVAAAGEWATELSVTGWSAGNATTAVIEMSKAWVAGPPPDYWSEWPDGCTQARSGGAGDARSLASGSITAVANRFAALATVQTMAEEKADQILEFLHTQAATPLETLLAAGRPPNPDDPACPIFLIEHASVPLICVSPARFKHLTNGFHMSVARKLREQGLLVTNGQQSSLLFTKKISGKTPSFYAFPHASVVGVGVQP